jgi:hypothetical protein
MKNYLGSSPLVEDVQSIAATLLHNAKTEGAVHAFSWSRVAGGKLLYKRDKPVFPDAPFVVSRFDDNLNLYSGAYDLDQDQAWTVYEKYLKY